MEGWGLGDLRMLQVLFGTFFFVHVHGDGEALPEGWVTDAGHDGLRRRLGRLVLFPLDAATCLTAGTVGQKML